MELLSHWQQYIASLSTISGKNQCLLHPKSLPDIPALEETKLPFLECIEKMIETPGAKSEHFLGKSKRPTLPRPPRLILSACNKRGSTEPQPGHSGKNTQGRKVTFFLLAIQSKYVSPPGGGHVKQLQPRQKHICTCEKYPRGEKKH